MDDIRERLSQFGVDVLYAVESGSRAYGFESADSDFDIRGIFKRALGNYLRLSVPADQIAITEGDKDYVLWDIRKAVKLLTESNPSILDWLTFAGCLH